MHFIGKEKFVAALDAAVSGSADDVVASVRDALASLCADPDVLLPPEILVPLDTHYARRLLHASEAHGYAVIAMTWGPGQGTAIHDHGGAWCVEGVWHGHLTITDYLPVQTDGDRWRFVASASIQAPPGSTGGLLPPDEYHTVRNASRDEVAVSIHVYERPMVRCNVFDPEHAGSAWTLRREMQLDTDQ